MTDCLASGYVLCANNGFSLAYYIIFYSLACYVSCSSGCTQVKRKEKKHKHVASGTGDPAAPAVGVGGLSKANQEKIEVCSSCPMSVSVSGYLTVEPKV